MAKKNLFKALSAAKLPNPKKVTPLTGKSKKLSNLKFKKLTRKKAVIDKRLRVKKR